MASDLKRASAEQKRASDPAANVWVSANAGSGKTSVLVDRIIRLMLSGADPERILCLTYTKAAAGEMANRLFERLSSWVAMDDGALAATIAALGHRSTDARTLQSARRLFTRALETPGGLKLQTIHAFCERLLQLFPIEAGVVPGFEVMEERDAESLLAEARLRVLNESDGALEEDFAIVSTYAQADAFDEIVKAMLRKREQLRHLFETGDGIDRAMAALSRTAGLGEGETHDSVDARFVKGTNPSLLATAGQFLRAGRETNVATGAVLQRLASGSASKEEVLERFFTTPAPPKMPERRKPGGLLTPTLQKSSPSLLALLEEEQERLDRLRGLQSSIAMRDATAALLRIASRIVAAYQSLKRARGLYDFEDLIIRTRRLLVEQSTAAWVLYKLDKGIDHILVDEAQDTSGAQWDIVKALAEEFHSGSGARADVARTVFAVGDRKQSIFSFQGADPDAFDEAREEFSKRVQGAEARFDTVPLGTSYRSTQTVLASVDAVFDRETMRSGIAAAGIDYVSHTAVRGKQAGLVEIWPLAEAEEAAEPDHWTAPVDRISKTHPRIRLAREIASRIRQWLDEGRKIAALGRAVAAGDILVLVRNRSVFNSALIKELQARGVPVAGADRLKLVQDIAVMDLLSLARFALLPEDDLSLAEVLRSPLCDADEERLFALSHGRGSRTLWSAVEGTKDGARLAAWRALAQSEPPFDFFSAVLVEGRRRFHARLGSEAGDALDAFLSLALSYEHRHGPSLQGFIDWFETGETEIKREMDQTGGAVRIMTVHGAKGLEAPIVFLADTTGLPGDRETLLIDDGGWPVWRLPGMPEPEFIFALRAARRAREMDEHRRLLYVAMTRARDELYVCGAVSKTDTNPETWYRAIESSMQDVAPGEDGIRRRVSGEPGEASEPDVSPPPTAHLPDWARQPPPPEATEPRRMGASARALRRTPELARGEAVHALLKALPDHPPETRRAIAEAYLKRKGIDPSVAGEVLGVMERFAPWFADSGLAEISLAAAGSPSRIDRLILAGHEVLIVDYKSDRAPPSDLANVNADYLGQLARYRDQVAAVFPDKAIRTALLWTAGPGLMEVPSHALDAIRRA
jgi:ATP-dependent helicase/nuclease subunit A